tara:strand:+ start:5776 stop:6042 length:267 start_codon:yes stop_codon:yes gene_type:complete
MFAYQDWRSMLKDSSLKAMNIFEPSFFFWRSEILTDLGNHRAKAGTKGKRHEAISGHEPRNRTLTASPSMRSGKTIPCQSAAAVGGRP